MRFSSIIKRYWPYIRGYKLQYFFAIIGIILIVISTAATAHIMQPLMDNMFINKEERMLYLIPVMLIGIYFVRSIGRYLEAVFTAYIGTHIVTRLRADLLNKIIHMDMAYLYKNRSGELISRITNDVSRVQYFVSKMLPELIQEGFTVIALIGYVIYLNATLAFWALFVVPIVIFPLIKITQRLKRLSHRSQEKNADLMTRLTEVFNNAEVIKTNATESYEIDRFKDENDKFFKINMKSTYTSEVVSPMMEMIASAGLAAVIFIGGKYVYDGVMSVGEFTAFLTAVGLVFQPLRRVSSIMSKIQDAQAASERVFGIFDITPSIVDGEYELDEAIKSIEFKNVYLNYSEKEALKDINLSIKAGETIALVGESGGGKSSLINLLLRFYDATSGELLINGKNIKNYTIESLKNEISAVTQRVYILQDTLAENIAYAKEIDRDRVIEALKKADAYEFAMKLENGIDTIMQENGSNLSGGQRQRIAIARAIYKNSSLLVLDEATSALDNESEKRIQNSLKEHSIDKITIIIAHRLSTIKEADKILFFENGSIIDSGTHSELLEKNSKYRSLTGEMAE